MYLLVRTLEAAAERLSGNEQAVARRVLIAAILRRGYLIMSVEVYHPAIEDADRALALIGSIPVGVLDDRARAMTTAEGYRLRMLCHSWLGREAEAAGEVDAMRRHAVLELADADRVVSVDEGQVATRESAPKDWADAVVEMRLGKTLAGRGILHAQQGRRAQSIPDLDRSVSVLGDYVRLVANLDQQDQQQDQRNQTLRTAQQLLARALELRASVLSGHVQRSRW
jgi:tetratricopeptide (TPR) repeat protein